MTSDNAPGKLGKPGKQPTLSHVDSEGNARMVDVSAKAVTTREATARGRVVMRRETLDQILEGTNPKGDVLAVARIAGIMAAKRTHDLIPLCHPLPISGIEVSLTPGGHEGGTSLDITATVRTSAQTGVEMEALTAVSVAALTVYDMCKAVERGMTIEAIRLVAKSGGQSGDYRAD